MSPLASGVPASRLARLARGINPSYWHWYTHVPRTGAGDSPQACDTPEYGAHGPQSYRISLLVATQKQRHRLLPRILVLGKGDVQEAPGTISFLLC
jgi:hypothetical protein